MMSYDFFLLVYYIDLFLGILLMRMDLKKKKLLLLPIIFGIQVAAPSAFSIVCFLCTYVVLASVIYDYTKNLFIIAIVSSFFMDMIGVSLLIGYEFLYYNRHVSLLAATIVQFIVTFLLFTLLHTINSKYQLRHRLLSYNKEWKALTTLIFLVDIGVLFYHTGMALNARTVLLTTVILFLCNVFFSLISVLIIVDAGKEKMLQYYMDEYSRKDDYYKKLDDFRHDYLNLLQSVSYVLEEGNTQQAQSLIEELRDYSTAGLKKTTPPEIEHIASPIIKGALYDFFAKAEKSMIGYTVHVTGSIHEINMEMYDFIRMFSIALTNAVEHYSGKEKRPIDIRVMKESSRLRIIIKNPAQVDSVDITKILRRGHSSKESQSGLGLYTLSKIGNNYTNVDYFITTDKEEQIFKLELTIAD